VTLDPHNLLPVTIERLAYLRATIEQRGVAGRPREKRDSELKPNGVPPRSVNLQLKSLRFLISAMA
jgi:hypothetical protein